MCVMEQVRLKNHQINIMISRKMNSVRIIGFNFGKHLFPLLLGYTSSKKKQLCRSSGQKAPLFAP